MIPADQTPPATSDITIHEKSSDRRIEANGIPNHKVGLFPNRGNPHEIKEQRYRFELETNPKPNRHPNRCIKNRNGSRGAPNMPLGIAINGVLFDPGTAEFWKGDRTSGWNYCALGGAIGLGLDENHAHVQPTGAYHYHGLPTGLLDHLNLKQGQHSPLIGWAADGYPVYALYGYAKKGSNNIIEHTSSYRLKKEIAPHHPTALAENMMAPLSKTMSIKKGSAHLDECNGCFVHTPEFPQGTYAYFLTENWPVIPRAFRADPQSLR